MMNICENCDFSFSRSTSKINYTPSVSIYEMLSSRINLTNLNLKLNLIRVAHYFDLYVEINIQVIALSSNSTIIILVLYLFGKWELEYNVQRDRLCITLPQLPS